MAELTELDEQILIRLRSINRETGRFVTGLLTGEITREAQIAFAHRLVDLAETIRDRVTGPLGVVIEGSGTHDSTTAGGELPRASRDD
jgi:hypothetical protein